MPAAALALEMRGGQGHRAHSSQMAGLPCTRLLQTTARWQERACSGCERMNTDDGGRQAGATPAGYKAACVGAPIIITVYTVLVTAWQLHGKSICRLWGMCMSVMMMKGIEW